MAYKKTELGRLAAEVRAELGLGDNARFDPHAWAALWGVPFKALGDIASAPEAVDYFTRVAPGSWSAALLRNGPGHVVVYNSSHSPERVLSNLAHEIAHLVAEHELDGSWMQDENGCGAARPNDEKEAAELAGALLVPAAVARQHAIYGRSEQALALKYGVSVPMALWRMRESGGTVIRQRYLAKQRRGR